MKILFAVIWCVLLLPLITFPISLDLAVFARGAEVIARGGNLYVDYVDVKPPLIYYFILFARLMTPDGETGLRIFDLIWQFFTAYIFSKVTSAITGDKQTGLLAGTLYALVYTAGFYESTFQCENMMAMPLAGIFYIAVYKNDSLQNSALAGLLTGICIALKFTFGIVAIAWFLHRLFFKKSTFKTFVFSVSVFSFAALCTAGIILLSALHSPVSFAAFKEISAYTAQYAALPAVSRDLIRKAFFKTGNAVITIFSLSYFVLAMLPFKNFFKRKSSTALVMEHEAVFFAVISFILLIFSAVVERKFFDYHYTRAYIPICFMAAVGLSTVAKHIRTYRREFQPAQKLLLVSVAAFGLIFSPLLSWGSLVTGISRAYFQGQEKYNSLVERYPGFKSQREQQMEIMSFLKKRRKESERVFVIGMDAARISFLLQTDNISKFPTAQFYLGSASNAKWRKDALGELKQAAWLIGQENDSSPYAYDGKSGWQAAMTDTLFAFYITEHFEEIHNTGFYRILKRRSFKNVSSQ